MQPPKETIRHARATMVWAKHKINTARRKWPEIADTQQLKELEADLIRLEAYVTALEAITNE